jgi:LAGLIDADG DNA endonuclease family protein
MANLGPGQYAGSRRATVDLPSYISGYVDGEGCFTVSISPRPKLSVGWEVRPSISVSQNGDRPEVLLDIQRHFGCGTLRPDRSDRTLKWEVRSLPLLLARVVPHFRRFPLRSGKRQDFELFADICERMARGDHLTVPGLREIVRRAARMNPSGKRGYAPETILSSLVRDEGIVCPPGNRGVRRSSDLHEWRNDLGTVSTRDSAKLQYE